jgi:hypothetical protein
MSGCPICMEVIEGTKNIVVTECGHSFHCKCLMQNAAHNGFGCPYCRNVLAEEPVNNDDDDDITLFSDDDYSPELITDNELTSFRMFNQRLQGEEVEQEPEPEQERDDESDDSDDNLPDSQFITQKLTEKGFTYEDLVKCLLWNDHSDLGRNYTDYERRTYEVYGQIKNASRRFARENERRNEITFRDVPDL